VKISDIHGSLVSVWVEWQNTQFLINKRFIRQGNVISWENYTPEILKEPIYFNDIVDLFNRGQYTFQVGIDGSLIQMYYVFDNKRDELISASLTFYLASDDPDSQVGWFRMDFDPSSYRGVLHPKCHMHISLFPNTRFIVDGVPSPKQFVELIAAICYPDFYQKYHINEHGHFTNERRMCAINSPCFHIDEANLYQYLTHIKIPIETLPRT
jgi:hypothetical protein